jgi:hypothetical protein
MSCTSHDRLVAYRLLILLISTITIVHSKSCGFVAFLSVDVVLLEFT